ncbi:MAG: RnfABCDGE type electron transport complex subunit B [Candidatus Omnitrophica bacterium]|nr:RnfABCDGE type electron transport complex subunit B [Candidatus Omnitrophota bacterium]MBU1869275.1 RnfABCDGE type electron transport complex subunit B [Candidatus Omnitrophota bacterium]
MNILIPILTLGVLGLLFGVGLALAAKKFCVETDPRLDKVYAKLPGANCGACGMPGCMGFAEGLIQGSCSVEHCVVCSEEAREAIAKILGAGAKANVKKIAVLYCYGGNKRVKDKFVYSGIKNCAAANIIMGGQKACFYGCIGLGDCVKVCPFGAITMSEEDLPIVDEAKCKACNKCVLTCPKKLFSLVPVTGKVFVACSSHDPGKDTKAACSVGCIACGLCVKACKFDAIKVVDNLAVIDYHKCTSCGECVKACPMKTIRVRA